jgi:hypothetical protein
MGNFTDSAMKLLDEFANEHSLSAEELRKKYDEHQLKEAMEALVGSSITGLLETENAISTHYISITDLQTDLRALVLTIKRCNFRV